METITLYPIGYVVSPVSEVKDMPPGGVAAQIEVLPQYQPGLLRLEENSHIWVQTWFHQAQRDKLTAHPRGNLHMPEYGVFAIRSPARPNPIALSLARLIRVENNKLYLERLDAVNGTPVLDINLILKMILSSRPVLPISPAKLVPPSRIDCCARLWHTTRKSACPCSWQCAWL